MKRYWIDTKMLLHIGDDPLMHNLKGERLIQVCKAADVVKAHEQLVEALTKLSTLGGGRSEGNCIAQEALKVLEP